MEDVTRCMIPALRKSLDKMSVTGPSNLYDQTVSSSRENEKQDFIISFF